ncbi:NUDIX domain-containing protein [Streptomyces polyrhachis]|uniref:NUDIX domain-containing protein n=1 Tax=Streptomyces polyrhachis TaxID=1282885 RepID=A0ABW2GD73_9ACTN
MIVWLNGADAAGATAVARALVDLLPGSLLYEPEVVADGLRALLTGKSTEDAADCRELPAWRRLFVDTAAALLGEVDGPLVVPFALLEQRHRDEVFGALAARRIAVRHLLLTSGETILQEAGPTQGPPQTPAWLAAEAYPVETAGRSPREAAGHVADVLRIGGGACAIVQTPEPTGETLAAGVLLFDDRDRVLLVDPTYKPGWEFPGGVVERGEPPARAGMREVAEELGLRLDVQPRLLVVDWEPPEPPAYGGLRLLFDGGRLDAGQRAAVRLPGAELRAWRFVTGDEAAGLLPPVRATRLLWALRARELSTVINLEAGAPVGQGLI